MEFTGLKAIPNATIFAMIHHIALPKILKSSIHISIV